jgi:subtilisin family serine protease
MTRGIHARMLALVTSLLVLVSGPLFAYDGPVATDPPAVTAGAEETSEVLVFVEPGTDIKEFAAAHGLTVLYGLRSDPNAYVLGAAGPDVAVTAARTMPTSDSRVRHAYLNERTQHVRMAFVPDDTYFHKDTPEPGWPGQWHLINEHTPGLDVRVEGAWNRDITGNGVTIGIVDDCLQGNHTDLNQNYVSADSWDFGENNNNPHPVYPEDGHGISVAGIAAARGGNYAGVTGAAPYAKLAGLRCDFRVGTTAMFVDATLYHSSGSTTPAEEDALETSAAAGTIHCVAAGNSWADANQWDLQNCPDAICVAALSSDGKYAHYSNYGACVFVTCPSSDREENFGITTTDRTGESYGYNGADDSFPDNNYTSIFGGTSAASPLAAGVLALAKEVQPNLNVRFAKHLLAMTSDIVDPEDSSDRSAGGWKTNAAGYHFNQNYGFGLINADALTQLATEYIDVSPPVQHDTGLIGVYQPVPDNDPVGTSRTFTLDTTTPVEAVEVYLDIDFTEYTRIDVWLTSPSGTQSCLLPDEWPGYPNDINWWFTTNEFWGEDPAGTWTLTIRDWTPGAVATWARFRAITHVGTLVGSGPPVIVQHPTNKQVGVGETARFFVQAAGEGPLTYQWQKDGVDLVEGGRFSGTNANALHISDCTAADAGDYRCLVSNGLGSATSDAATLAIVVRHIVESRAGGKNHDQYSEFGTLSDSTAKSNADGTTSGIGSRWAYMDRDTYGVKRAVYSYTPNVTGLYAVSVTWPASTNASSAVEHIVTHAGGSTSVFMDQDDVSNPGGANQWNTLGSYNLNGGVAYTVTQTNENAPDPGQIFRADAVRWQLLSAEAGPQITEHPQPQIVCSGDTAVFAVSAVGRGTLTYQWQRSGTDLTDGGDVSGAATDTLAIANVDSADAGDYRCVVTDDDGTVFSNPAALTPGEPTIAQQPADAVVLEGGTATFTVGATGLGTLSYQWQKDGADLADGANVTGAATDTLEIAEVQSADEGSYQCVVASDCGATTSNAATLTVQPQGACVINGGFEDGFSLDGVANFWTKFDASGAVTTASSGEAQSGIYSQRIYSANSADEGGVYQQFNAVPGQPYTVSVYIKTSNADVMEGYLGIDPEGGTSWAAVPSQYQDMTVSETWARQTVTFTATADRATVFLAGHSTKSTTAGYVYFDTVTPDCETIGAPVIIEDPSSQTVSAGQTAQFTVQATGEPPLQYQWQKAGVDLTDGGHYSGTATDTLTISNARDADEGSYRCVVTNTHGSATSTAATLTVNVPTVYGDFDDDGDIDLADYGVFLSCYNGANQPPQNPATCGVSDFDNDGDVDLTDYGVFLWCYNGPGKPPACS